MKKVIKCMGMMALIALAFTSCKKQEQSTCKATIQDLVVEDEDRAYIDGNYKVHFEVGDRIMIFNISNSDPLESESATYRTVDEGTHVELVHSGFGNVGNAEDAGYYAYYPSSFVDGPSGAPEPDRIDVLLEDGENKSRFLVSPEQEYRPDMVALKDFYLAGHVTQAEAPTIGMANFHMQFICGVLQLKPYEAAQRTVTRIEVVDNFFNLSGWVEVIIPEIDNAEMTTLFNSFNPADPTWVDALNTWRTKTGFNVTGAEMGNVMGLDIPGGVQLGNTKATTPVFNIVLRPLALTYGCHIIFHFADGGMKDIDLSSKNLKIKPNVVKSVGLNMDNY